jgi:hypothetical protein
MGYGSSVWYLVRRFGESASRGDGGLDILVILRNKRRPGRTETPGPSQAGNRCRILWSHKKLHVWDGDDGWAGIGACHDAGLSCPPPSSLFRWTGVRADLVRVPGEGLELLDSA